MRHLFGRFYFKAPCFIGIRCDSRRRAIAYNIIGLVLMVTIIALIITGVQNG